MSECPHCRAPANADHRHDCAVARRTGAKKAPAPVAPLYLGAVVRVGSNAALCVQEQPFVLRIIRPDGSGAAITVDKDTKWSWPAGGTR